MKNVTITLKKGEIMSDVVNIAHVTGRRLMTPETAEKASDIQTPEDGVDKYIVARAMAFALAEVRKKCARYLNSGRLTDNNGLEDITGDFVLNLQMPDRWNHGVTSDLTQKMHAHAVHYCVYAIFEKTNPQEAANYLTKATAELNEVKSILELRTAPIRRSAEKLY